MADIFISYAHEDRAKVEPLFMALKAHGWSVFWDQCIAGGEIWDAVIEEELKSAERIVVVWSKNSLTSNWVKAEALEALDREILIPVCIEEIKPPILFRIVQTFQFSDWDRNLTHPQFKKLVTDLENILGVPNN